MPSRLASRSTAAAALAVTVWIGPASAQDVRPHMDIPRAVGGKPNLAGIWQARNTAAVDLQDHMARLNMPAGRGVVVEHDIPYQPWAASQKAENLRNRRTADPLGQCYMPGVPRIMYLGFPFQIFQTPDVIAIAFEWSHVYRTIYTDGSAHPEDIEFWMGDSRGRWEGETLVVDVANHNDKTWLDAAGNFHTDALHVVERYTLIDRNTLQYEATIEDSKAYTKPWTIAMPLHRQTGTAGLLEYACQAEVEEENGAFPRDERTWYAGLQPQPLSASEAFEPRLPGTPPAAAASLNRTRDGRPSLQGVYQSDGGGGNQGLERRSRDGLTPAGRGLVVDPPDGKLPALPWAKAEQQRRAAPERGYDDPTAHCFAAGVPRSMYVPQLFQIVQTDDSAVFLFERMSWRIVPLDGRPHLPDHVRLWQGDSVGRWEGDSLVVDTTNLNGKTWLNEVGEIVSHAEHVVERFTPIDPQTIRYEATVSDPIVYARPWTIAFVMKRQKTELLEVACHEDDQDLAHLKAIKDAAAGRQ